MLFNDTDSLNSSVDVTVLGQSTSTNNNFLSTYVVYVSLSGYKITILFLLINLLLLIIGTTIIILNIFVIVIILRLSPSCDVVFTFLINLAVADASTGVILIYNSIYNLLHFKNLYECLFRFGAINGIIMSSSLQLVGLNCERYVKIVFPFRYSTMFQEWHVKAYAILAWITSVTFAISPMFSWIDVDHVDKYCLYFGVLTDSYLIMLCASLLVGCCILSFMYIHILLIASSKLMPMNMQQSYLEKGGRLSKSVKALPLWWKPTKTVLMIVGVNLVALLPVGIYLLIVLSGGSTDCNVSCKGTLLTYISAPVFLNGLVNPLIYAYKIPSFKRTLKNICFRN